MEATLSQKYSGTSSMNLTHFFTSFDMPTCFQRCMPSMDNVGAILDAVRKPETIKGMCANLTESSKCATAAGCNDVFVGAISNAFQFMCMDNLDKVSVQFACIQDSAGDLQQACEAVCAVQADVIENAAKNTADQLFSMEKMCNATHCLANCYQDNLPKYCDIGKNNVFDMIFSQLESFDQQQPGIFGYLKKKEQKKNGIAKILGWMMPNGCDDEAFKIKIPKKIPLLDKPKTVGSLSEAQKEIPRQKTPDSSNDLAQKNTTSTVAKKSTNQSSAAIMISGKLQTLQCQLLDTRGNPVKTPDFETLSKILHQHFNKESSPKLAKPTDEALKTDDVEKSRPCRDLSSKEPRSMTSGAAYYGHSIIAFSIMSYLSNL